MWDVPSVAVGAFLATVTPPLGLGTAALDDGSSVTGFLRETHAVGDGRDISELSDWRAALSPGRRQ